MIEDELVEGIKDIRREAIHRSDEKLLLHLRSHIGSVKKLPSTNENRNVRGKLDYEQACLASAAAGVVPVCTGDEWDALMGVKGKKGRKTPPAPRLNPAYTPTEPRLSPGKTHNRGRFVIGAMIVIAAIILIVLVVLLTVKLQDSHPVDTTVIERTIVNQPIVTENQPIIQQTFIDNSTTVNSVVKHELPSQLIGECITLNNDTSVVNCNGKIYHLR